MSDILNERDEHGHHIVPLLQWWKFIYDIKTPTWQKFGIVAFVQAHGEGNARAAALEVAKAEYPGAEILPHDIGVSTQEAADAFAERKARHAQWMRNSQAGIPNTRESLERGSSAPCDSGAVSAHYRDALAAARDALVAFQKQAGWLPEQGGYSTLMTDGEQQLARAVADIDAILQQSPPVAAPVCADCGVELNAGEAKCFTVCTPCWDKAYAKPGAVSAGCGTGWQPIATAPEAEFVFVWLPNYGECVATKTTDHHGPVWWAQKPGEIVNPSHWRPRFKSPQQEAAEASAGRGAIRELIAKWRAEVKERAGQGCGCYGRSTQLRLCADELDALIQAEGSVPYRVGENRIDPTDPHLRLMAEGSVPAPPSEQCICAAIRLSNGEVWRGHRHDDAIQAARKAGVDAEGVVRAEQGFITSCNRFVGRREAARIQAVAGIVSPDSGFVPRFDRDLFSEDLYLRDWRSPRVPSSETPKGRA